MESYNVTIGCSLQVFLGLMTLLVGQQKGHPTCKKLLVGLLVVTI